MGEFVRVTVTDAAAAGRPGVGTLALSRPPTNTLTRQAYREITAAAVELSQRADVTAVVLFGGHEIFSAGDELAEWRTLAGAECETFAAARRDAVQAVAAIAKPTVAAITGYALGAGLTLALAADRRISGDNVRFGATQISAELPPDGAGLSRLARTIGVSRAKDLAYSGRFVDAEEALAVGLVDQLVAPDGVYDAALAWVDRLADHPPRALAAVKTAIDAAVNSGEKWAFDTA